LTEKPVFSLSTNNCQPELPFNGSVNFPLPTPILGAFVYFTIETARQATIEHKMVSM
jgi:hypothetical protein